MRQFREVESGFDIAGWNKSSPFADSRGGLSVRDHTADSSNSRVMGEEKPTKEHVMPGTYLEALKSLVAALEKNEEMQREAEALRADNRAKAAVIRRQASSVDFVRKYVSVGNTDCLRTTANKMNIRQEIFIEMLQDENILYRMKDGTLMPYACFLDQGYFIVHSGVINKDLPNERMWKQTRVTAKGHNWLRERLGVRSMCGGVEDQP